MVFVRAHLALARQPH